MLRFVLILAFMATATAAAIAAAWTLERGHTQTFVTSSFSFGDHSFDDDGNRITVPEYRKFTLNAALEYGVRPWLTGIVRGEIKQELASTEVEPGLVMQGSQTFGSAGGGVRVRLREGSIGDIAYVVSTEALGFSGGMDTTGLGSSSEGPAAEARLLVGLSRNVMGKPAFAGAEVGYRQRFREEEPEQVKVDITLGAQVLPRWMVLGQTFSTIAIDGSTYDHKVSASVVRTFTPRLRVEAGAFTTVAGQNARAESGGRLGFWWQF